jgi:hypothetical protein
MVDRADLGFFGAVWRVGDFCQQLNAGSVYLQFFLRSFCASKKTAKLVWSNVRIQGMRRKSRDENSGGFGAQVKA